MDFVSYLQSNGVTPHSGLAEDLANDDGALGSRELFYMYYHKLTSEKAAEAKMLAEVEGISFEDMVFSLGYAGEGVARLESGSEEYTSLCQAQAIVDAGICTLEAMNDHLFMYRMENILNENTVDITEDDAAPALTDEYLTIVEDCFLQLYKVKIEHGGFSPVTEISNDFIMLQQVVGKDDNAFTSGLAIKEVLFLDAAKELYERLNTGMNNVMPDFGGTVQDAADLFCEAVNNMNGFSTYRFSAEYDLMLVEYGEAASLSASEMYVAQVEFLGFKMDLFLIIGMDYTFSKAVVD